MVSQPVRIAVPNGDPPDIPNHVKISPDEVTGRMNCYIDEMIVDSFYNGVAPQFNSRPTCAELNDESVVLYTEKEGEVGRLYNHFRFKPHVLRVDDEDGNVRYMAPPEYMEGSIVGIKGQIPLDCVLFVETHEHEEELSANPFIKQLNIPVAY